MGNKMITKADIVLAIVLLVLGLGSPFLFRSNSDGESRVIITADGEEIGNFALSEDRIIAVTDSGAEDIGHMNIHILPWEPEPGEQVLNLIVIENGKVRVAEASCRGGDCVRMGSISREGELIACLPHKLLISITGGGEVPDAVIK